MEPTCNLYKAVVDGLHYKITQIDRYDWLTEEMIDNCHSYMNKYVNIL